MAFNSKDFISDILKDIKIDDTKKNLLLEVAIDPTVSKKFQELHEGNLRQSEFGKKMDDYDKKLKGVQDYWQGLVKWKETEEKRIKEELDSFRKRSPDPYGSDDDLDNNRSLRFDPTELKKEYDDRLRLLEQNAVAYNNTLVSIGLKHLKEFGEVLDTNKLVEVAQSEGLNILGAYERMAQPLRDEKTKTEFEKQLEEAKAKAREEGKMEALKNGIMPIAEQSFNNIVPHALDKFSEGEEKPKYGWQAAVAQMSEDRRTGKVIPNIG